MAKKIFDNVSVVVMTQESENTVMQPVMTGLMSHNGKVFHFQETKARKRNAPRPKLYEGRYISLAVNNNGEYQMYLKQIVFGAHSVNVDALARAVEKEMREAVDVAQDLRNE